MKPEGRSTMRGDAIVLRRDSDAPLSELPAEIAGSFDPHVVTEVDDPRGEAAFDPLRLRLLPRRLSRGDSILLAVREDRVAGWLCASPASHYDPWSGIRIRVGKEAMYVYDLWVEEWARPHGAARWLLHAVTAHIRRTHPDRHAIYGWVDRDNLPSLMVLTMAGGFREHGSVRYLRLFDRWGLPTLGSVIRAY